MPVKDRVVVIGGGTVGFNATQMAVGLGAQSLIRDFVSGLFITLDRGLQLLEEAMAEVEGGGGDTILPRSRAWGRIPCSRGV